MLVDCDDDTVLVKVRRLGDGNVCHTGERTCFSGADGTTEARSEDTTRSHTERLLFHCDPRVLRVNQRSIQR